MATLYGLNDERSALIGWPAILQVFGGNEALRLKIRNEIVGTLFKHDSLKTSESDSTFAIETNTAPIEGLAIDGRQYNWQREQNRSNTISKLFLVRPETNAPLLGTYMSAENYLLLSQTHHAMLLKILEEVIGTYAPAVGVKRVPLDQTGKVMYYTTKPEPRRYKPLAKNPTAPVKISIIGRFKWIHTIPSKFMVENASAVQLITLSAQIETAIGSLEQFGDEFARHFNEDEHMGYDAVFHTLQEMRLLISRRMTRISALTPVAPTAMWQTAAPAPWDVSEDLLRTTQEMQDLLNAQLPSDGIGLEGSTND